mgnify:FL=1
MERAAVEAVFFSELKFHFIFSLYWRRFFAINNNYFTRLKSNRLNRLTSHGRILHVKKNMMWGTTMDFLTSTTHLHITTWVIGLILFFLAATGIVKSKGVHMALRLFYILIIISGGALYYKYAIEFRAPEGGMDYDMKFLFGILLIGMMEMVLVRQKKNKSTTIFWGLFVVLLFLTLFYGLKLPIGMDFF